MRTTHWLMGIGLFGAVACGDAKIDFALEDVSGRVISDVFFGAAVIENQPFFIDEDRDNDGNLDVEEDLNDNNIIDEGEDVDGDGFLDSNEDSNGNGVNDASPIDDNGDGVIDELDSNTRVSIFIVGTTGAITCDDIVANIVDNVPLPDDTVFSLSLFQSAKGGIPNAFISGATVEERLVTNDTISMTSFFGNAIDGELVPTAFTVSAANETLAIEEIGDVLVGQFDGALIVPNGDRIPLSASFRGVQECESLSEVLLDGIERVFLPF